MENIINYINNNDNYISVKSNDINFLYYKQVNTGYDNYNIIIDMLSLTISLTYETYYNGNVYKYRVCLTSSHINSMIKCAGMTIEQVLRYSYTELVNQHNKFKNERNNG